MLIHPWDRAARDEWRAFLDGVDFGQLVTAGHVDGYPVVVPSHFLYDGEATVLLHLARPNPFWRALEADPHVVLALAGDYAYVEAAWNANPGRPDARRPHVLLHRHPAALPRRGRRRPDEKAAILARARPRPPARPGRRGLQRRCLHRAACRAAVVDDPGSPRSWPGRSRSTCRRRVAGRPAVVGPRDRRAAPARSWPGSSRTTSRRAPPA